MEINVDEKLICEAMHRSGFATEREVIEEGLRLVIQVRRQAGIRGLRGKVHWDGDLKEMRSGRASE